MKHEQGKQTAIYQPIIHENHILIYPRHEFQENISPFHHSKNHQKISQNKCINVGFTKYQHSDENSLNQSMFEEKSPSQKHSIDSQLYIRRRRKNKIQKMTQIRQNHSDDGRGGNCVASNICKTLLRIIFSILIGSVKQKLQYYCKKYEVKSQKQNTIIIILILHVLVKQKLIEMKIYEEIMSDFFKSLKQSELSCERKFKEEETRKQFHQKNRKMYIRFAEIDRELYIRSVKNIMELQNFELKELQQIISETYDRKQREVQKAMNKLKSIILNHDELKQFFDYHQVDIEMAFFESIDYAFRRNLPKRCRQVKQKARLIIEKFKRENVLENENEKFLMCLMTLKLIDEKEKEIWNQFVTNLSMKQEFNRSPEQLQKFKNFLEKEIPSDFNNFSNKKKEKFVQIIESHEHETKIEQETNNKSYPSELFRIYEEMKQTFQF